ncbi:MAG: hypothetical protein GX587_09635 [Bacteroidales bacterium]|nr:hypothetical protein [Bacteroidales bacterium]
MKKIILTSSQFAGEVGFGFNERGWLTSVEILAEMDEKQHEWLIRHFPQNIDELQNMKQKSKTIFLSVLKQEVTFDMFWDRYDHKAVSSKKKSQELWKRMSEADRHMAYEYIPRYFNSLPGGIAKKYCETYLNSKLWNN